MDEDWSRGQLLGRGSTATVSIATLNHSGLAFAVKSAELSKSHFLWKEQSILSRLNCPQIVKYQGCSVTQEDDQLLFNIFLEYAPGGTLTDTIRKNGGWLNEGMIISYARDILLGLNHLHSNGIVHCDIKGHNILVTNEGAKIADFGCAKKVGDLVLKTPIAGTPLYMAPEVARGEHQGYPADLWALGCTVIEMATGKAPWSNSSDPVSAIYKIGYSGDVPEIPSFMSEKAKDFVSKCLKSEPTERWSASELLKHVFMTEESISVLKNCTSSDVATPTSVLDQCLWDTEENLEPTWKWTPKSCFYSLMERIQKLAQGTGEDPNWAWDNDSWVTVRSKDSRSSQDGDLACPNEAERNSAMGSNWFSGEHNLMGITCNELTSISGIGKLYISNGSYLRDDILFMLWQCSKDDVYGSCNFEKEISISCSTLQFLNNLHIFRRIWVPSNMGVEASWVPF